jgi:hypothetical protein
LRTAARLQRWRFEDQLQGLRRAGIQDDRKLILEAGLALLKRLVVLPSSAVFSSSNTQPLAGTSVFNWLYAA